MQVSTWLSHIAFHLQLFWLQTLDAIDASGCFQAFSLPSEVAVLFDLNLSRRPVLDYGVLSGWRTASSRAGTQGHVPIRIASVP